MSDESEIAVEDGDWEPPAMSGNDWDDMPEEINDIIDIINDILDYLNK